MTKFKKFRIKNFKSIEDTGYCDVSSDITVLAGKNESGKTSILEALKCFNFEEKIPSSAIPLNSQVLPSIELIFEVDIGLLNSFVFDPVIDDVLYSGDEVFDGFFKNNHLCVIKTYGDTNDKYKLGFQDELIDRIRNIAFVDPAVTIDSNINIENGLLSVEATIENILHSALQSIPKFIYFDSFEDLLPFETPFAQAATTPILQNFAKLANINLDTLASMADNQTRRNILSNCSAEISGDFSTFWEQESIEIIAESDGGNLIVGVEEGGNPTLYKAEQRSKGFQWFLSFYIRLNAEKTELNIILIDEPGLYLHATAQENVLSVLEFISKKSQAIFSTHSPYLIDTKRLDRIRLVEKNSNGTKIINKIHAKVHVDTLTPIMTAIGLDISKGIEISGKNNIVLTEGISDYYYLSSVNKNKKITIVPCVGASKIPILASLLIGWGISFVTLLDNDRAGKNQAKKLSDDLDIDEKLIIFVSEDSNHTIEDVFSIEDFNEYVLGDDEEFTNDNSISQQIKNKKLNKVTLGRGFSIKCEEKGKVKLSKETIDKFKSVFSKIEKALEIK